MALGGVAAGVAAIIYFAVTALTGYEIGWIALLTGLLVGGGVWLGCGRRGGRPYQVLAVFLTYYAMGMSYGLLAMREYVKDPVKFRQMMADRDENVDREEAEISPLFAVEEPTSGPADAEERAATQPAVAADTGADEPADAKPLSVVGWAVAFVIVIVLAFILPIVVATESMMAILFVGIAMWEAWRINKRRPPDVTGPHRVLPESPVT